MKSFPALVTITALLLLCHSASAQNPAPRTIAYSGYLTDGGGAPLNGNLNLVFRLFNMPSGGTMIYEETHDAEVLNGVYHVELGSGTPTSEIDWDAVLFDQGYWLEMKVDGEVLTPRTKLLAAPYAASVYGMQIIPGESDTLNVVLGGPGNGVVDDEGINAGKAMLFGPEGATVGGGSFNKATGKHSAILGGYANRATEEYATIAGGVFNESYGNGTTVGGGSQNRAGNFGSTIGGGLHNLAEGTYSFIGGGYNNKAAGSFATVPGGRLNEAKAMHSFAAGHRAIVRSVDTGTFVWADSDGGTIGGADFESSDIDQFLIRPVYLPMLPA